MRTGLTIAERRPRLTFWQWLHGRLALRRGECPACGFRWRNICSLCSPYWRAHPHRRPGDGVRPSAFILAHWRDRYRVLCLALS
jgi:hypothetical protein